MPPRPLSQIQDPRSLLLEGRPEVVSDTGLLSVLAADGVTDVGSGVLHDQALADAFWRVRPEELVALEGVGPVGAARVLACLEIARRVTYGSRETRPTMSTPEDVVRFCGPQMMGLDREHFWALALNTKNRLMRVFEVSVGSLNASIVHPRELFKDAVRVSAASIIAVHNHPSGDPTPSGADIQLTKRLVRAGDLLGVELLDHVVIGERGEHRSMRDLGLM